MHYIREDLQIYYQLKLALNSNGDNCVFNLNNLLNDCGCSKPS
jgi:hypothetical protein